MKKYLRDYVYLFGLAGIIVALDQWTKALVRNNIEVGGVWAPWHWILPYARIIHWNNTGAAFGMLQGFSGVFTVLAILVSIIIIAYFYQVPRQDWPLRLAMVMQLGGAVGNLIDRIMRGTVTDFVSVGNFAVFNVADASISIGVAVLVIGMWIKERAQKSQPGEIEPPAGEELPASITTNEEPVASTVPEELQRE